MASMTSIPAMTRGLRFAQLSDLPRIGVVAAAGFYHSPVFHFERPLHDKYPLDTMIDYQNEYQKAILNPASAVLVMEEDYGKNEVEAVYDALSQVYPPLQDQIPLEKTGRVVVGVISMCLRSDANWVGAFWGDKSSLQMPREDPQDRKRDKSEEALKLMDEYLSAPGERWLSDKIEITTLVVHPAYWRQGHGSALTSWCLALSDMDQMGVGVSATPMGRDLFARVGFAEVEIVKMPGYKDHQEGISLWIGTRNSHDGLAKKSSA